MKHEDRLPTHTSEDDNPGAHDDYRGNHNRTTMFIWVPIMVFAAALAVAGVASAGLFFVAVLCVGMMAVMMYGVNHSGSGK